MTLPLQFRSARVGHTWSEFGWWCPMQMILSSHFQDFSAANILTVLPISVIEGKGGNSLPGGFLVREARVHYSPLSF